jgi:hypothetical protein
VLRFGNAAVRHKTAGIELNLDLFLVSRTSTRHPIHSSGIEYRFGVERHITFHVHHALVKAVDLGNPRGQRFQLRPLHRE